MVQTLEAFQKEFMPLEEGAQILQVQTKTFYDSRWRKSRGINLYKFGNARKKYLKRVEIFSTLRAK